MRRNELKQFFSAINFNDKWEISKNCEFEVKYFHHNQTAVINLIVEKCFPIETIATLEKCLNEQDIKIDFDFSCKQSNYSLSSLMEYFEFIKVKKLKIFAGIFVDLPLSAFTFVNNTLVIRVHNTVEVKLVERELTNFIHYFNKYGFKLLKIKVNSDPNLITSNSFQDEIALEIKKVQVLNSQKVPSRRLVTSKKSKINLEQVENTHKLSSINEDNNELVITGTVIKVNKFFTKNQKWFFSFLITDFTDAIFGKLFAATSAQEQLGESIKINDTIKIFGNSRFDSYAKEQVIWINDLIKVSDLIPVREDKHSEKRVEFHVHTKMSAMDGISSAEEYIKTVAKWNHRAIAFSDHLNIQAYPEIARISQKYPKLKIIYGVEMNLVPQVSIVFNSVETNLSDAEYLVFDLETTGLSTTYHEIIEFGYAIVKNGMILQHNTILIKPNLPVPEHITEITSITNEMLKDAPNLGDVIAEIKSLVGNRILVAHNATFDIGFLNSAFEKYFQIKVENVVVDTLQLARVLNPELKYYRLGYVCKAYGIKYDKFTAHRADYDANVLAQVFLKMINIIKSDKNIRDLNEINQLITNKINSKLRGEHITVYAKNQAGLKQLYRLVSDSHTKYFANSPKIHKEAINENRKDLLIGSACANGVIFESALNRSIEELKKQMEWFDFIEIQPPLVYQHLINKNQVTAHEIELTIKKIIYTAKELKKVVIASSDAHYVNPHQKIFREVIINTKGLGGVPHPLFDYKNNQSINYPEQHLRTTEEMLKEFAFLKDEALIDEIVITNTNKLSNLCESVVPIKTGLYTPEIDNVEDKLRELCYQTAIKRYGTKLPEAVAVRLNKELNAIIDHGFAVVYWIAHKLVEKSLSEGYLVGSRGSVGSSLVATLTNITEVNPLQPHYLCKNCYYFEIVTDGHVKCGYDLPEKLCPECQIELQTDGHDIPFETFLGIDGDKIPDIDLNFSGEYQIRAHDFTKEMFGENNVFRAGTISTVATKTAYGFAKNYAEQKKLTLKNATIEWLGHGCEGVKRTTGQHPGGIIVVPKKYEINDFTPINFPADDDSSNWKTTHFDFEAIHDNLLKLDILGHVDPTALRMLHDLTGIDPKQIPNQDAKVLSLFSNLSALKVESHDLNGETTGGIGIPEFGTGFVRKMLVATKPQSFAQLVQISGLSHGTDVWLNNAEHLISKEGLNLKDVIGCRDDIMTYLVYQGLPSKTAFFIMEDVRKGKGLKPEFEKIMREFNVPQWYIQSCRKIKYMFPKAHATAYVLMAWRVAWYKVYYPHEYYCTYFSTRCDIFELQTMLQGKKAIIERLNLIEQKNKENKASPKEKDLVPVLEVALEMYARNIHFSNIDLTKSEVKNFKIDTINDRKVIIPPFTALDGLGEVNAQSIIEARKTAIISSIKDLQTRTSITKTNFQLLKELGVLDSIISNEQVTS